MRDKRSTGDETMSVEEIRELLDPEDLELSEGENSLFEPCDALVELINQRLRIFEQLDQLEDARRQMLKAPGLSEDYGRELQRQSREIQGLGASDGVPMTADSLQERITALQERMDSEEVPEPLLEKIRSWAMYQWKLLLEREQLGEKIPNAARGHYSQEPLYQFFHELEIPADELFGWTFYALGLDGLQKHRQHIHTAIKKKLSDQPEDKTSTLLGRIKGASSPEEDGDTARLKEASQNVQSRIRWIGRELNAVEGGMAQTFWNTYQRIAEQYVSVEDHPSLPMVRAFLRYGMISRDPALLNPEIAEELLAECAQAPGDWDPSIEKTHVLYADEYLYYVAKGVVTPSISEDLELNHRHSPEWHADKALRRIIHTYIKESALNQLVKGMEEQISVLKQEQIFKEEERDGLDRKSPDYRLIREDTSKAIQHCKVTAARYTRQIEKVRETHLPELMGTRDDAKNKFRNAGVKVTPNGMARQEADSIRKVTSLCAHMNEHFPPFDLRDNFKRSSDRVNDRKTMEKTFAEIESKDPSIFLEQVIPSDKKEHRVQVRYSPIILLTPGSGTMGYSWNPRKGSEVGRLAFPLMCPRGNLRNRILYAMLADFRWDTSKAAAGVDLMTSDTLVAGYSAVRWKYRQKGKDIREKALIFTEETDRKNWGRHYQLHMDSAMDGGKKLFFKCPEAYDVVIKYMDLPQGVERLRK